MNVILLLSLSSIFLLFTTLWLYKQRQTSEQKVQQLQVALQQLEEECSSKESIQGEDLFYQSRLAQMGEMISMIAHQWRQPLSAISLTAIGLETKIRLKKLDFSTPEHQQESEAYILGRTELIAQYVNSMTTTIDDFRMFYKKDRQKELVTIEEIIERTLKIIGVSLEANEIDVTIKYHCNNKIWLFPNELVQVFLNLLQNSQDQFVAHHITPASIIIGVNDTSDGVHISFCDNAGGIDPMIINKIFRPYFSTKDKQNGTGLGLYMSKTIIDEHHGGCLSVHNRDDASGACFHIDLPVGCKE